MILPYMARSVIAAEVRAQIARSGKTNLEVAAETGIPTSTFSHKTSGRSPFLAEELVAIARALGIMPSAMIPADALERAA
jgi:hypothetical protein